MSDNSSLSIRCSLALSSSQSRLILALAAASSTWEFELVAVLPSEVFKGPAAALPAAIVLGMVIRLLG